MKIPIDLHVTSSLKVQISIRGTTMAYTVKMLSKLSKVSIRTLHYYDQIGLLKPAYYGDNQYRYYEAEQLLMLQQILFYRELGFSLNDIQRIINSDDFNKMNALISHKKILEQGLDRTRKLVKTIDKTIAHLRGENKMKDEELYYGFESEKQKKYEKDLIEKGIVTQNLMDEFKQKTKHWSEKDKDAFIREGKEINDALIAALTKQLKPSSKEVQAIIRKHHAWVGWSPTKEKYIELSRLYLTPEFKKFYEQQHSDLLKFIVEAMKIFAENELS